jgi:hypothetical protein
MDNAFFSQCSRAVFLQDEKPLTIISSTIPISIKKYYSYYSKDTLKPPPERLHQKAKGMSRDTGFIF